MSLYVEGVVTLIGINVILAVGYWLTANTNQFSLGHAGFMAIGAYASSVLTVNLGWPLPLAMLLGGLLAGVVGAVAALPGLRLSLLHLAMVTLAFAEMVQIIFANWDYVGATVGFSGMSGTSLPLVAATLGVILAYVWAYARSRVGLNAIAVREDEIAASAAGLSVTRVKVSAFGQSALVTGIGGALLAHHLRFIQPDAFDVSQSVVIVLYVVFGGLYSLWGPVVGATVLTALPEVVDFLADWYLIVYGSLFVVVMAVRPQGIIRPARLRVGRRGGDA